MGADGDDVEEDGEIHVQSIAISELALEATENVCRWDGGYWSLKFIKSKNKRR